MNNRAERTALEAFFFTLSQFKRISGWAIAGGVAVPFVASLASITPPWPSGIELMTAVVEVIAIMVAFQFLYRGSRARASSFILVSVVLLFISAAVYLFLMANFTYTAKPVPERVVSGFQCLDSIAAYDPQCPFVSEKTKEDFGYRPELLWTTWSVAVMKATLALAWLFAFVCLSGAIGGFVVFQSGQRMRAIDRQNVPKAVGDTSPPVAKD